MDLTWQMLAIVCPLVFLAGFIDSIAGGGGLISLPAYYLAGLPAPLASGTNKLSAGLGTLTSTFRFVRGGKVVWRVGLLGALGAIPVVAIVVLRQRSDLSVRRVPVQWDMPASAVIGLAIGFYDGLIGPGTGTFLIIAFTMLMGMEGVMASGTAKIVNLSSNISALLTLLTSGNVLFGLGLPAALCGVAGNWLGAGLTMKKGTRIIRTVLLLVLALLLAKMVYDVL